MSIKERFLSLTSQTYPHGKEHELFDKLPQNLEIDEFGNLFIKLGDSDVMFTSHLDTATSAYTKVNHVIEGNIIKTDGTSILGADDKAGVTIMLHMIENGVPGLYYFFLGEEVGCVGSKKLAESHRTEKLSYINKVISFDRRGTDSVITYQSSSRCCSDKFGEELAKQLNLNDETFKYKIDPTGIYTDSAQFVKIYPECTNISVGYYSEHTFSERQDIEHLTKLAEACLKVDWSNLPVERDPSKTEYTSYGSYGRWRWDDDDYDYIRPETKSTSTKSSYKSYIPSSSLTEKINFWDEEYRYISSIEIKKSTGEIVSINLSQDRLITEREIIYDFLEELDIRYETMLWDGKSLRMTFKDRDDVICTRGEMEEYLDELDITDMINDDEEEYEDYPIRRNWNYNWD